MTTLQQVNTRHVEPEAAKKHRQMETEKNMVRIKQRADRREYQKIVGEISGFDNKSAQRRKEEEADLRFMMAFGIGFISVMFLGFLTGFCIGKFVLAWDETSCCLLALATGIPTLIVEALLMIIRLDKWEEKREQERKK